MRDEPVAKLAAVADSFHSHAIAIKPQKASQRSPHAVQYVLRFIPVLIAEHGVGELLPVSGRPAIIHHQGRPTASGVNLVLEVERHSLLPMRTPMDIHNQWILGVRL